MKELKRILIAICVIGTLSQSTPSANAQAAAVPGVAQGLTQLGMSLAGAVAPLLIPIAATVLVNGVRVGLMMPGLVKEKVSNMSMPRLRRHKQVASSDTADGAAEEAPAEPPRNESADNGAAIARGDYASASVSGEVMSATETRQAEEEAQEVQEEQEAPRPQRRPKPAGSDWYQE